MNASTRPPPAAAAQCRRASRLSRCVVAAIKGPILAYRYLVSPLFAPSCRFYPSCSQYACEALERHGPWRGGQLALRRLARCHPWCPGGEDPVPEPPQAAG